MKQYLVFFGAPGSGKGTQAKRIAEKLNLPVISTGEMFRQEINTNTPLGKKVKGILASGTYVPDRIVEQLIEKRLKKSDSRAGAIFDGYPRTEPQQRYLIKKLADKGSLAAILIEVSDKEITARLGGRRACICGHVYHLKFNPPKKAGRCDICEGKLFLRNDDKPAVIKSRLKVYHQQTEKLLDYWSKTGNLIKINGELDIKKVEAEIIKKLKKHGISKIQVCETIKL